MPYDNGLDIPRFPRSARGPRAVAGGRMPLWLLLLYGIGSAAAFVTLVWCLRILAVTTGLAS